ncbi:AbrB family transcriptional regulator [Bacillus thermotolerans]|uniref:Ammonia monooxygenase n=1 Tax=Bacillus thermotolerans TaxID=1221996 RepID=A0A0F5HMX5_BACTR|nr:AbrB family transcriptional regulator [Bacillus thermotolerans]KKB34182.1 putative ammonia monooxygenase [Bacillus thermotolerans]KKB37305.1 putative ammonia monooxygenase [Bacillus thermotolerans]KKB39067.1 putative ammonia monooxygenase [Bacillus thermotolerans]
MRGNKWLFLALSAVGGFLLSLTGMSIGWMLGALMTAAMISFIFPAVLGEKGLPKSWMYLGQLILGIELGRKINLEVVSAFQSHGLVIVIVLLASIAFSLLSGYVLWKFSQTDMMTSFFGTTPGGLSAMPAIAEETGANTGVVSIIQTMRVFLVVLIIPVFVSMWAVSPDESAGAASAVPVFEMNHAVWTAVLVVVGWGGYHLGKRLKFPAPWLLGSMLAVAVVQSATSTYAGHDMTVFWPHELIVLSQILIAASIGSRLRKSMFVGLKRTLVVAFISTAGLIAAMFGCAALVAKLTGISFITAVLAFAPGGIAEMATTAIVLHADSTFVVAVQVLRVLAVVLIMPVFFRLLHGWEVRKGMHSHASA